MAELKKWREIEDAGIAFAELCDTHGLSVDEGTDLAEGFGDELMSVAEERRWQDNVPGNEATS